MFVAAVTARAMGNDKVEMITPAQAKDNFLRLLNTPERETGSDQDILMKALFPNG